VTAPQNIVVSANVTGGTGGVSLTGQGTAAPNTVGVRVQSGAVVSASGSGTVVGKGGSGTGDFNYGVLVLGSGSQITSGGGAVAVTGIGNTGPNPAEALRLEDSGSITSGGNAPITITADSVNIITGGTINSGSSTTTIRPRTAGTRIDLGGADVLSGSPLTLGLTSTELNQITAGTLVIGDANAGELSLTAPITRAAATDVELRSGGGIVFNGGSFNTGGGTLLLAPGTTPAAVQPLTAGTDATASTVSFASDLAVAINGPTVDTGYDQLNIVGTVDLSGVNLVLSGGYTPFPWDVFTVIKATQVIGQFNGLPDGAVIDFNGIALTIRYRDDAVVLQREFSTAGNVTARIDGGGRLVITGDGLANGVLVERGTRPGVVVITGLGNTTVNGRPSVTLGGLRRGTFIGLGEGDDVLCIGGPTHLTLSGHLAVDLGRGANTLNVKNVTVAGNSRVITGREADRVVLTGTEFGGRLYLRLDELVGGSKVGQVGLEPGDNDVYLTGVRVVGEVRLVSGRGNDRLRVTDSSFAQMVKLKGRSEDDTAELFGSTFDDLLYLNGGSGSNTLNAGLPGGGGNGNTFNGRTVARKWS